VKPALPGPWDSPPPAEEVAVEFGAWSRRGPSRAVNDDHYLVLRLGRHQETLMTSLPAADVPQRFDEYGYGMVIADGMGAAGEPASRLAITTLVRLAIEFGRWHLRVTEPIAHEVVDRAERFYRSVDSTLLQAATTVTLVSGRRYRRSSAPAASCSSRMWAIRGLICSEMTN
jgi:serine/threonine protein phosphatase PrpC